MGLKTKAGGLSEQSILDYYLDMTPRILKEFRDFEAMGVLKDPVVALRLLLYNLHGKDFLEKFKELCEKSPKLREYAQGIPKKGFVVFSGGKG
jgi:hypothetical protein